jgi:hypothetical protein
MANNVVEEYKWTSALEEKERKIVLCMFNYIKRKNMIKR